MLQMVEYQRGVCVLPEWLADSSSEQYRVKKLRLGKQGIYKTLYAMLKKQDQTIPYINKFIEIGKESAMASRSSG